MDINDRTIALLIDADNISKNYFQALMDELNQYGKVTYKRIYGDFTSSRAKGWRDLLLPYGITPIQQYAYVKGKNATDSAMIIDAMDILYSKKVDCFCLATSDSDFTRLATRFKEENYIVLGAGETKTPQSFKDACDRFILMDVLLAGGKEQAKPQTQRPADKNKKTAAGKGGGTARPEPVEVKPAAGNILEIGNLTAAVKKIIEANADLDGWAYYSVVMNELYKKHNDFNPKNYGSDMRPINFFKNLPGAPLEFKVKEKGVLIKAKD